MRHFLPFFVFFLLSTPLFAQPANDLCENAIQLDVNQCSGVNEYSIKGATQTEYGSAYCMAGNTADVWFQFTAIALNATITVNSFNGSFNPEIVIYSGQCSGTISEIACATDSDGGTTEELNKGGLTIGETYLVRISGRNTRQGDFQICINNFNPSAAPGGDCATRALLCDKSSFTVEAIVGVGNDPNETNGTCMNGESSSTWFAWTCGKAGDLGFVLTPTKPLDDLDFVLYELPNGVNDCSGKTPIRCMAAGGDGCKGPTGLSATATGVTELQGCRNGNDGFVSNIQMEVGKSYALVINNFSDSGNGFIMEFSGSGEFKGSEPAFTSSFPGSDIITESFCLGNKVEFKDASTSEIGTIEKYSWSFGTGASIATATGANPPIVTYNTPGTKSVVLTIENSLGCIESIVQTIEIDACCETVNKMEITGTSTPVECFDSPNGMIDINVTAPFPPTDYAWDNGATTEDLSGLTGGSYVVTVSNAYCRDSATFTVASPPAFSIDTVMTFATCSGGKDGSLTLNISGGTPPYAFKWFDSSAFIEGDNKREKLAVGSYNVSMKDAKDCQRDFTLQVTELELKLDPNISVIEPPSCYGYNDGRIRLVIQNGVSPFQYDWNDGKGYVDQNSLNKITGGTFNINVIDNNKCKGSFSFDLSQPDSLSMSLEADSTSCFDTKDGTGVVNLVTGGTPPYRYFWDNQAQDSTTNTLSGGIHNVSVTDANGCVKTATINIPSPGEITVDKIDKQDIVCHGDSTGTFTIFASGGSPSYTYATHTAPTQSSSVLANLAQGAYTITVTDSKGCSTTVKSGLSEPQPFTLDLGPDTVKADLGIGIQLNAQLNIPIAADVTWTPKKHLSCETCFNPIANPPRTTEYIATATDFLGCPASDSITVYINKVRPLFIPNSFTPNGDRNNDWFTAYGGPAVDKIVDMEIYDRWGALIYRDVNLPLGDENSRTGWDGKYKGKLVNEGVYIYVIRVRFIDGIVGVYKGSVTLLNYGE